MASRDPSGPSPRRRLRRAAAVLALAAIGLGAWGLLRTPPAPPAGEPSSPGTRPRGATPDPAAGPGLAGGRPGTPAPAAPPRPVGVVPVTDGLRVALSGGDADAQHAAAAALRRRLRTDPAAWREAAAALLSADTPPDLRQALALVFGTLPGEATDPLLRDALSRFGASPELARVLLLALGADRDPPDDDDVFGLADRPHGIAGPGALGITVGRAVTDPASRLALADGLHREDASVRRAAALALRGSLASADAREAFVAALSGEAADDVLQELGEALVQEARRNSDASERGRLLGLVLRRASDEGLDGLRFRIEDDLAGARLGAPERAALRELAGPDRAFGPRAFSWTVLASAAPSGGAEAVAEARGFLAPALAGDADPAARDLAARLLHRLPADPATQQALARAARSDAAWNVRWTALETYAALAAKADAVRLLEAASGDGDARVAAKARELLAALETPR